MQFTSGMLQTQRHNQSKELHGSLAISLIDYGDPQHLIVNNIHFVVFIAAHFPTSDNNNMTNMFTSSLV